MNNFKSAALLAGLALVGCSRSEPADPAALKAGGAAPQVRILSNRADLISGGDALIEIVGAKNTDLPSVKVEANGHDVTGAFQVGPDGRFIGLVSGLAPGSNTVTAHVGGKPVEATLINHRNGGPILSGPQLKPWTCRNSAAIDADCNQPPEYSYFYKSTDPNKAGLQPYDPANPATDVASTTTDQGVTVPFIVRQELGYQDRDQYRIAVLFQPGQPWTAAQPQPQFNHKMLVNHGVSCGVEYQSGNAPAVRPGSAQGIPLAGGSLPVSTPVAVLVDATEYALGKGFAVMSTALDYSGHNCNIALQAESLIMAKERTVEQYGELRYTIGEGCSGGSLAQQWIANAYPGIYQGILPTCSFPDAWGTASQFADYHLTLAYFTAPSKWGSGVAWTEDQMAAVQGHVSIVNSEVSDNAQFHVAVPTDKCGGISDAQRYEPTSNPGGVRCSVIDAAINLFGPRPPERWSDNEKKLGRGFADVPLDNVGVQYGLGALQAGRILPAQFVDLNQKMGGFDVDIKQIPERFAADEPVLANAYRSGMINEGNNLDRTAIIDCRGPDPGAFHDAYRAFAMRARLDREHGNHDNQVIWEGPVAIEADNQCAVNSFIAMDQWLAAAEQDLSDTPLPQKLTRARPVGDACWDGDGQKVLDQLCPDAVMTIFGTPRTVAGDALTTDTNKCQLKPLDPLEYGVLGLDAGQIAQMQELFPDGVCDFSKPGVQQQGTVPWQTYQDAGGRVIYGGKPMPAAPANSGGGWAGSAFQVFAGGN